jgi:hypothetical protein
MVLFNEMMVILILVAEKIRRRKTKIQNGQFAVYQHTLSEINSPPKQGRINKTMLP